MNGAASTRKAPDKDVLGHRQIWHQAALLGDECDAGPIRIARSVKLDRAPVYAHLPTVRAQDSG
jgi:hypothetical protein